MTLVRRGARFGISGTSPVVAHVGFGAGVAVIAIDSIRGVRVDTRARGRIASAGEVALVGGGAHHRVCPAARAIVAGIGLGAGVAVVAYRAIGGGWIGTQPGQGIACARNVALIGCGADLGCARKADAGLTRVCLRARIVVAACRSICDRGVSRHAHQTCFARTRIAVVDRQVRVVCNVHHFASAVTYMEQAVVGRLRHDGCVFGREVCPTYPIHARTFAAFIISARTIVFRDAPDAAAGSIADLRLAHTIRTAIRTLGFGRIGRNTSGANILRACVEIVGKISVVILLDLHPATITHRALAIALRLTGQFRIDSSVVESAYTHRACTAFARIVGSRTITGHGAFPATAATASTPSAASVTTDACWLASIRFSGALTSDHATQ